MQIQLSPEQELQLARIASHEGAVAEELVKAAAMRILEENERFLTAVEEGIASADRGELIDYEDVVAMMEEVYRAGHKSVISA